MQKAFNALPVLMFVLFGKDRRGGLDPYLPSPSNPQPHKIASNL
jgi:hypothetical protein